MKLIQLLSLLPQYQSQMGEKIKLDVPNITSDSRQVKEGSVFVAIQGEAQDGHQYIGQAIDQGAIGLVVQHRQNIPEAYRGAVVEVKDTRQALNSLASYFYGSPADQLFCVGVTGTNGKTSVCYMVEQIFNHYGWPTGVMGTIDHHFKNYKWDSQLTTPDSVELQGRLKEFINLGAEAVAFEVSSHALVQKRADPIPFNTVVFTNLSRDHLDYHNDMKSYFEAKEKLFRELPHSSDKEVYAIINTDDPAASNLRIADKVKVLTYGQENCDLQFNLRVKSFLSSEVHLITPSGEKTFNLPVVGLHNVYNAVAAIGVGLSANISLEICCEALSQFKGIPGRLQFIENQQGKSIFVDYAHTDDALTSVLKALNAICQDLGKKSKIISVFGCGGDRDPGKRPLMGQAAIAGSNKVVVTSDNPRTEDPVKIVEDILEGVHPDLMNQSVFVEIDRKQAIKKALELASENDVVLIVGKGHENYQVIGDQKIDFDDVLVVRQLLRE